MEDSGEEKTRRSILSVIGGGLSGVVGGVGGYKLWGEQYEGKYGPEAFETGVDLYEKTGREEIPTHDMLEPFTNVPDNPSRYITPDDELVETYADTADIEFEDGQRLGRIAFDQEFNPMYMLDEDQFEDDNHWMYPRKYLEEQRGDCEDYALAMASIMESLDHPTRTILGVGTFNGERAGHAMTEVKIDDTYYALDIGLPSKLYERSWYDDSVITEWTPLTMFGDDTPYQTYDPDW